MWTYKHKIVLICVAALVTLRLCFALLFTWSVVNDSASSHIWSDKQLATRAKFFLDNKDHSVLRTFTNNPKQRLARTVRHNKTSTRRSLNFKQITDQPCQSDVPVVGKYWKIYEKHIFEHHPRHHPWHRCQSQDGFASYSVSYKGEMTQFSATEAAGSRDIGVL